jgi:ADP-ribosylglycohydrolase/protein-tyrosine phosphatase
MRNCPTPMRDPSATGKSRVVADVPPPFPNSYWVLPGKLLAGEYPGGETREETRKRVQQLLAAGIECFIDLTMPDELTPYDLELPISVEYIRKPIKDHGLPARREHMLDIQACLEYAMRAGQRTYVHCRAGIGRTGTVVGCFLIERGMSAPDAMEELNRLWQRCQRAAVWPHVPETDEQTRFVLSWTPQVAALMKRRVVSKPAAADPLLDTSTLTAARSLRDRFLGALVGLAVGDALGTSTQYKKAGTFPVVGDMVGGGPFDLPRGAWSDDTAMALCVAESLVEKEGFDPRDQVERYAKWQQHGYLSATGQCVGITGGTAKALSMAKWRRQKFSGSHDPTQLDPEVLSRVAPAVMFFFASPAEAVTMAGDTARTTCQSAGAVEACRFLGAVLYEALSGKPKNAVLAPAAELIDIATLRTNVALVAQRAGHPGAAARTPRAGDVVDVLEAALWAFRTTNNFRDGALLAANLGGNSDVAAAAFGQIAGAHYGIGAIPGAWRNSLINKDLISGLADRLLAHAMVSLGG